MESVSCRGRCYLCGLTSTETATVSSSQRLCHFPACSNLSAWKCIQRSILLCASLCPFQEWARDRWDDNARNYSHFTGEYEMERMHGNIIMIIITAVAAAATLTLLDPPWPPFFLDTLTWGCSLFSWCLASHFVHLHLKLDATCATLHILLIFLQYESVRVYTNLITITRSEDVYQIPICID